MVLKDPWVRKEKKVSAVTVESKDNEVFRVYPVKQDRKVTVETLELLVILVLRVALVHPDLRGLKVLLAFLVLQDNLVKLVPRARMESPVNLVLLEALAFPAQRVKLDLVEKTVLSVLKVTLVPWVLPVPTDQKVIWVNKEKLVIPVCLETLVFLVSMVRRENLVMMAVLVPPVTPVLLVMMDHKVHTVDVDLLVLQGKLERKEKKEPREKLEIPVPRVWVVSLVPTDQKVNLVSMVSVVYPVPLVSLAVLVNLVTLVSPVPSDLLV